VVLRNLGEVWEPGSFHIAELDWSGPPDYECTFAKERTESGGISQWTRLRGYWRLESGGYHGSGIGECETYSGDLQWTDYTLEAELVPLIGEHHLINARVQGALYSYAFGLAPDQQVMLYKKDKTYTPVASASFEWSQDEIYQLRLTADGDVLTGTATAPDGRTQTLTWRDDSRPYLSGQIGLSTWHGGHTRYQRVGIHPIERQG
jgi:hypothetical protein